MRESLEKWIKDFSFLGHGTPFKGHALIRHLAIEIPKAIRTSVGEPAAGYLIEGSAGQGGWSLTPWIAVLDPTVTTTVQEGYYVVYLLSSDGQRLYLTLNQGCTALKTAIGIPRARRELLQRAESLRYKIGSPVGGFKAIGLDLASKLWRPSLYESGEIVSRKYNTDHLPSDAELVADLKNALVMYRKISVAGGWDSEDIIIQQSEEDGVGASLRQAKRYRQHRAIERQSSHSKAVKRELGTRCMGCDLELHEKYGPIGKGLIHAHHLHQLSALEDDAIVSLDPKTDFAVLCPNCHAIIHRMEDVSDVGALRSCIVKNL